MFFVSERGRNLFKTQQGIPLDGLKHTVLQHRTLSYSHRRDSAYDSQPSAMICL